MNQNVVYRDAVEDEEDIDRGEIDRYFEVKYLSEVPKTAEDLATSEMIAEIVELSIAEEVDRFPWRQPHLPGDGHEVRYSASRILSLDYSDGNPSILARMAKEIARVIQFPENTTYLHGIGVFSSAAVINFQVEYNDSFAPVGMYTLGAQPSGSGKSSAHGYYMKPIEAALTERNKVLTMLHKNIDGEIEIIQKQADKVKTDLHLLRSYASAIGKLEDDKIRQPIVRKPKKNSTPQSAEEVAAKQGGVFNMCSDEQEAIDTYLGLSYTDGKSSPDNGVFIAAFGGDTMGTSRISREGIDIAVRGAFAVISQNAGVDIMIKAGVAGRGVSERCLIIKERSMIGYRTYSREISKFDPDLMAEYTALCHNVCQGTYPLNLKFSEECLDIMVDLKNDIEPQTREGAKYGDSQIKGFASKIQQHVGKMAAIFHIAEQWNPVTTSHPSFVIERNNLLKAMLVCMDLLESYKTLIESASSMSGSKLVIEIIRRMKAYSQKGTKNFTLDKLRMAVMKEAWYASIDGKKIDFLAALVARCEEMNFCHIKEIGKDKKQWQVLINPALATFTVSRDE